MSITGTCTTLTAAKATSPHPGEAAPFLPLARRKRPGQNPSRRGVSRYTPSTTARPAVCHGGKSDLARGAPLRPGRPRAPRPRRRTGRRLVDPDKRTSARPRLALAGPAPPTNMARTHPFVAAQNAGSGPRDHQRSDRGHFYVLQSSIDLDQKACRRSGCERPSDTASIRKENQHDERHQRTANGGTTT